jgi:hypothetical protein
MRFFGGTGRRYFAWFGDHAGVESGLYRTVPKAVQVVVRPIAVYDAIPSNREVYQHSFQDYQSLARALVQ